MRKLSLHAGVHKSKVSDSGLQYLPKDVNTLRLKLSDSTLSASGLGSFADARAGLVAIHLERHTFPQDQLQALPAKVIIKE